MAKKTFVKIRMVPESKPDSPFFYYLKKPAGGEKAKVKLSAKNIIQAQENTNCLLKKNFHLTVNNYFFLKFLFVINISSYHINPDFFCYFWVNFIFY